MPGVIKDAYNGLYVRTNAIVSKEMSIGYWADVPQYNQNIALAKSYMRKGGLKDITLKLNVDNSQDDVAASRDHCRQPCPDRHQGQHRPGRPGRVLRPSRSGRRRAHPQLLYYYYGAQATDPNEFFEWWTCDQVGLWNWDHWCNPEFTKLTNDAYSAHLRCGGAHQALHRGAEALGLGRRHGLDL